MQKQVKRRPHRMTADAAADEVLELLRGQRAERERLEARGKWNRNRERQQQRERLRKMLPVPAWLPKTIAEHERMMMQAPDLQEWGIRTLIEAGKKIVACDTYSRPNQSSARVGHGSVKADAWRLVELPPSVSGQPCRMVRAGIGGGAAQKGEAMGNEFERAADLNAARAAREAARPTFKLPAKPGDLVKAERALAAAEEVRKARYDKLGRYPLTDEVDDQVAGDELARLRKEFPDTAKRVEAAYAKQGDQPGRMFRRSWIYNAAVEAARAEVDAEVKAAAKKVSEARERWAPTAVAAIDAAHEKALPELLALVYQLEGHLEPLLEALSKIAPAGIQHTALADHTVRVRQLRQALEWSC
jgi:hypothetical protein